MFWGKTTEIIRHGQPGRIQLWAGIPGMKKGPYAETAVDAFVTVPRHCDCKRDDVAANTRVELGVVWKQLVFEPIECEAEPIETTY